jgi:hypothetical protein
MVLSGLLLTHVQIAAASPAGTTSGPISVSVAALFVGETKVVEGVVTAVDRDTNVVKLRLGTPPQSLTVSLVMGLLSRFPPNPEIYYAGKTVLVAGTIDKFRDELEMTIREPANVEVVNLDVEPQPNLVLREQQEAMRAHIRALEERVRELEDRKSMPPPAAE